MYGSKITPIHTFNMVMFFIKNYLYADLTILKKVIKIMFIGFTGSHRTGKTTLIKELDNKLQNDKKIHILDSPSNIYYKNKNKKAVNNLTFEDRIKIQNEILDIAIEQYEFIKDKDFDYVLIDRTPIDFIGYTLFNKDIPEVNIDVLNNEYFDYKEKCINIFHMYFDYIVYIQPGIKQVKNSISMETNKILTDKLDSIMGGLIFNNIEYSKIIHIKRYNTKLEDRLNYVYEVIKDDTL